jgi:hypothetical protein
MTFIICDFLDVFVNPPVICKMMKKNCVTVTTIDPDRSAPLVPFFFVYANYPVPFHL